ncbi:MAG TPA: GNAT family N-acetyltransferase [Candidatus Binatia bacterium]|nr:GNAT family N-acetyltransferase [Candidatus Binatia bacterium]
MTSTTGEGARAPAAVALDAAIVPMRAAHIGGAVQLHQKLFPNETMVRLGPIAMEAVYRTYIDSPSGVAFVATHADEVGGVATGVIGPGFLREVVRTHPWRIAAAAAVGVARSPRFVSSLLEVSRRPAEPWPGDRTRRFYLRMQMVAPEWRGRGIVLPMVRALFNEARRRGARDVSSTIVGTNLSAMWVHKVFGFESCMSGSDTRYYRLDLDKLDAESAAGSAGLVQS